MTVFKTFWKVVKKYKGTIILYTSMLIIFGGINLQTNNTTTTYVDKKPDILIINNDKEEGLTKNLINYINENTNIKEIKNDEIGDIVLKAINLNGTYEKEKECFELIEKGLNMGNVNLRAVSLGKTQDGLKNITLADIWIDRSINHMR